jgi:sugar/nucleoside kinase (ribokinase family)
VSNNSNTPSFDVVVIGNPGIDTNVYVSTDEITFDSETVFTKNVDYIAHAAGFSSRGFAQLGYSTGLIGTIGDDHNGRFIRQELARDGIDVGTLFTDPNGTSRSVNFVFNDGRRKNFYDGKGHMVLGLDLEKCRSILKGGRLAFFSIPNWGRNLLPIARDLGLIIATDIQDVKTLDDPYRQDFIDYSDILFFSAANQKDPADLIKAFLDRKPGQIVIAGMGAAGCALGTKDGIQHFEAVELPEPVVDTNGAGDSLAVGFLTSYIFEGYSLTDSIKRGQLAARYTCTLRASSDNLIDRTRLDQLFSR